jgi:nitroreductase
MNESILSAWDIAETRSVGDASPRDLLILAVNYAILAPSSHNSQPWQFRIKGEQLELYADRSRALAVVDYADRELVISCGAALFCVRATLQHLGVEPLIELEPEGTATDLLARVRVGKRQVPTEADHILFQGITERRTTHPIRSA